MHIVLKTIPHNKQAYDTVGDWIPEGDQVKKILVSDMGNEQYALLVAFHELIESTLCLSRGVADKDVVKFDMDYEEARASGFQAPCGCTPTATSEPGKDKHAPYRDEHCFAEKLEKMLCKKLGIDWQKYEQAVNSL